VVDNAHHAADDGVIEIIDLDASLAAREAEVVRMTLRDPAGRFRCTGETWNTGEHARAKRGEQRR